MSTKGKWRVSNVVNVLNSQVANITAVEPRTTPGDSLKSKKAILTANDRMIEQEALKVFAILSAY